MYITQDIRYIGVNDHQIDLFEGQYPVPQGMSYNSYVIKDYKIAVMDTVDQHFTHEWLDRLAGELGDAKPDYLVVHHMEPDHSANILNFMKLYPEAVIVSSAAAFRIMNNCFGTDFADRRLVVGEGDSLPLGKHVLQFITAPMVHWPEVIMSYDKADKVLFSADGFGRFGALDRPDPAGWVPEARRYYFGIVGRFGKQVQALLNKAQNLDIRCICPLHGPVLKENLEEYLNLYNLWSSYQAESQGVVIAYTSVYGHTLEAVKKLGKMLKEEGAPKVVLVDLAREESAQALALAFQYSHLVLATTTYNGELFPAMRVFCQELIHHNYQNRTLGLVENGSWAPQAGKAMDALFRANGSLRIAEPMVTIQGALNETSEAALTALAQALCQDWEKPPVLPQDPATMFKIGYGLYVLTSHDGKKDNGCIVNTVSQVASSPNRIAVCVNKLNYSHDTIKTSGKLNLNCLSTEAPFALFKQFGFASGRDTDKLADTAFTRSGNGLAVLKEYINAFISLRVEDYMDLGSHGMFLCSIVESAVISDQDSMSYSYYQANVKPKRKASAETAEAKKGWVCKICGYVHEGEELPPDFICPICKHGAEDFERQG